MKTVIRIILAMLFLVGFVSGRHMIADAEDDKPGTIIKDDFENCEPKEAIARDEFKAECWNLRVKTWSTPLLCRSDTDITRCPDLTYDPKVKGIYNIYVETRAVSGVVRFWLRLTSDADFSEIVAPNEDATADYHYNVWVLWKQEVKMDGEKIIIRDAKRQIGETVYIDAFKFEPVEEP